MSPPRPEPILAKPFWERPLTSLNKDEWEALCDGCGKCCLNKLEVEDEESGDVRVYPTNVTCRLLDRETGRCSDYRNRRKYVPDCIRLTAGAVVGLGWLPMTCAYRLRSVDEPLPAWHYLISGSRETVHSAGQSVRGWTISEVVAGPLENHLVERSI